MALVIQPLVLNTNFPVVRVCVTGRFITQSNITAVYPTRCGMDTCVNSPKLCVPQHDTRQIVIDFIDSAGVPYDVSTASEIEFIISRRVTSNPIITKTKSGGTITLTNNTQARLDLSSAETGGLQKGSNYYECRVSAADGSIATVLAGPFVVQDTRIGD